MFLLWKGNFIVSKYFLFLMFSYNQTSNHPHTNSAKAALNMMTRTAAVDYAKDRIYMNR
jgi:NAD(P)-dependent dehydrogenase (short-subunit alcohol dehydrogenase family)